MGAYDGWENAIGFFGMDRRCVGWIYPVGWIEHAVRVFSNDVMK